MNFLATQGEQSPKGKIFFFDAETTAAQLNCSLSEITEWLQELINAKLIVPEKDGKFSTPDENVFLSMETSLLGASKAA